LKRGGYEEGVANFALPKGENMANLLAREALARDISRFFEEDDLSRNTFYTLSLSEELVACELKIKSDLVLAGLPWFVESFRFLGATPSDELLNFEGKSLKAGEVLRFELPFSVALTGERIALNLLARASSIATTTREFAVKAKTKNIAILDTRKTTPGLRALEKYAVAIGGGMNHRLGQGDLWMVKDNHKSFFGGIKAAVEFFKSRQSFYTPIEVEIHDLKELVEAMDLGVRHLMLDNFSPEKIKEALALKRPGVTYEVSGGVRLNNLESYLIEGIDAISVGTLTASPVAVDISLKYAKKK
jgi:nicotinate-nucleotide pyrophosphorylase (carboxylating)